MILLIAAIVGLCIQEPQDHLKKTTSILLNITRPAWTLRSSAKWLLARGIMSQLYPAQNSLWKRISHYYTTEFLDREKEKLTTQLHADGFLVQDVILEKNNVQFSGLIFTHPKQSGNGKWVLQATGNGEPIEWAARHYAPHYLELGYNLLMINNPGVGRSQGVSTSKTMGETQELAIQYLEETRQAKKIVLAGFSLGGAAIGQAILQHQFQDRDYLVIRQMTFDRVSTIFEQYAESTFPKLKPFCKPLIQWAECEMDSVAASKRLSELNIPEVIIQAGTDLHFEGDGTIPAAASLGYHLHLEGLNDKTKFFYTIPAAKHRVPAAETIAAIKNWELK